MWLTPTEEELRARYNPDLRKRSLENQEERQQEFDDFVGMLKEYSKSDKHSALFVTQARRAICETRDANVNSLGCG